MGEWINNLEKEELLILYTDKIVLLKIRLNPEETCCHLIYSEIYYESSMIN